VDAQFGGIEGVIRTHVGYTGGSKENPNYRALGDHSESIEIYYDPKILSYSDLLEVFWKSHNPENPPWSRQYMSAIFYHNDEQKRLATESLKREEARIHKTLYTKIMPALEFYPAEDYHQKYYLRQRPELVEELRKIYPGDTFVDSTAAARINGFLAGNGAGVDLDSELRKLIPAEETGRLMVILGKSSR
jgi:peptide-methionine (S)-S-oxide reductase